MWKLNKVGGSILKQYTQELLADLKKGITEKLLPSEVSVLIPNYGTSVEDLSVLIDLLTAEPQQLIALNTAIMSQLVSGYTEADLLAYQKAKIKKNKQSSDINLINQYEDVLARLKEAFDYKGNITNNPNRAYRLTEMKGSNVCTYCNRQYIFTVNKPRNRSLRHIVRPELDHWFCQELFPLLSLSFYNLIPSCHICNSTAKGSAVFSLSTHIHPYIQHNPNPNISFKPVPSTLYPSHIGVKIDRRQGSREDATIKAFALDEIYDLHGHLEVEELFKFNNTYSTGYLKIVFKDLLNEFCPTLTKAEVYRMLFGTELDPKKFGERPMSKLKYDILKYLKVI